MGSGYSKIKKQQKALAEQFGKMQQEMQKTEHTGTSGNGLVTVVLTGEGQLKSIKIKKECVDPEDIEGLEDLILAAFKDASEKVEANSSLKDMPGLLT